MSATDSAGERIDRLIAYLQAAKTTMPRGLSEELQLLVLRDEAYRLVDRIDGLVGGRLPGLTFDEAWAIFTRIYAGVNMSTTLCMVRCEELRDIDDSLAKALVSSLRYWLKQEGQSVKSQLFMIFQSDLNLIRDTEFLDLAKEAHQVGWHVAIGGGSSTAPLLTIEGQAKSSDAVVITLAERKAGSMETTCTLRIASNHLTEWDDTWVSQDNWQNVDFPKEKRLTAAKPIVEEREKTYSVSNLFGDYVTLRDLEPRDPLLPGLQTYRDELGWDASYVPRKNEPQYAEILMRIMGGIRTGGPGQIVFIGDTLLNDGGAIRSLQTLAPPGSVWGFLCGASGMPQLDDIVIDGLFFGARWDSLVAFFRGALDKGLMLDKNTFVLFDLDQTVYAAKCRDDASLYAARWEATRDYLREIIPAYKFDATRAEAMYREFDRDIYHAVTRDNMDYVVLLVMAVASGLADPSEIKDYAQSSQPSIGALAEELGRRASTRVDHEDIGAVFEAIKAVHYNTIAGDQTPCKDFRRIECLAMARHMRAEGPAAIALNREVFDVIRFLDGTGANLMAFSDRPVEATVADHDNALPVDLISIGLTTRGTSIGTSLSSLVVHEPEHISS